VKKSLRSSPAYLNRETPKELSKKTAAQPALNLPKSSSIPFFLPKNDSPAPAIAPDKPALRPDWRRTVAIKPKELIIKSTIMAIFIPLSHPLNTICFKSLSHILFKPGKYLRFRQSKILS
jgi:hypothetical protein